MPNGQERPQEEQRLAERPEMVMPPPLARIPEEVIRAVEETRRPAIPTPVPTQVEQVRLTRLEVLDAITRSASAAVAAANAVAARFLGSGDSLMSVAVTRHKPGEGWITSSFSTVGKAEEHEERFRRMIEESTRRDEFACGGHKGELIHRPFA